MRNHDTEYRKGRPNHEAWPWAVDQDIRDETCKQVKGYPEPNAKKKSKENHEPRVTDVTRNDLILFSRD
jgi:hypothetical protein